MQDLFRRSTRLLMAGAFVLLASTAHADDSLYRAWGGKAGIRAVLDDLVPHLKADARIGRFFKYINSRHLAQQLSDQLCIQAGGPCTYDGETLRKVHVDMGITKADFNRLVELLQDSMDARGIPFSAQNAMLARLAPMHRDIIDVKPEN